MRDGSTRHRLGRAAGTALALAALGQPAAAAPDSLIRRGSWDYHEACATCHGADGTGGGALAAMLTVAPPDLTTLSARNGGAFPFDRVFRIIDGRLPVAGHGTADMPVWGRTFREEAADQPGLPLPRRDPELVAAGRIHALALFLEAIQGGKDMPPLPPAPRGRTWPEDIPLWKGWE